jgi:hypothetical protein
VTTTERKVPAAEYLPSRVDIVEDLELLMIFAPPETDL